jgi:SET domain-containing protein
MNSRARKSPEIDPQFACFSLRIRRSGIHGWGVYSAASIPPRRKIIEYTGERITPHQALARHLRMLRSRRISMFRLNRYWRIDAAVGGSGAEYINHSCNPNLTVRRLRGHILLVSLRHIRRNEELTFDYGLHPKTTRMCCHCGAANCRGTLNRK